MEGGERERGMDGWMGGGGGREREREYNKVQVCLGFENFYSKVSPVLGLFQGLPGRLDSVNAH